MISICFQGKPFNITIIQICAPTTDAEEAEGEWLFEDLQDLLDLLELTQKNDVLFIIGDWNTRSRKSSDTWNKRQVWPWSAK